MASVRRDGPKACARLVYNLLPYAVISGRDFTMVDSYGYKEEAGDMVFDLELENLG